MSRFRFAALVPFGLLAACGQSPAEATGTAGEAPRTLGMCATCHGIDGRSRMSGTPHLAAQDEAYLVASMLQYRAGQRPHAAMRAVVGALTEDDVRALAAWYARQAPCPQEDPS